MVLSPVASHAEAWIETLSLDVAYEIGGSVASHAEAWIETLWEEDSPGMLTVASHAEAWIETRRSSAWMNRMQSPPTRRRGLKLR